MKATKAPAVRAPREAFLLAGVGGSIDAVGVLTLGGLFVAHMSGNSAAFGAAFGQGDWRVGLPHLVAIPVFVLGLFLGYLWILKARTYLRCAALLAAEAVLLAVFFGLVVWCTGERLCRMLLASARVRRLSAIRAARDVMARPR